LEKQKTASHQGGGFNPPAEIYLVSFPTTHRRELSFPIKGTLALPLPGCQTRIRVVPDVAWDRSPAAAKGNDNLCHSKNSRLKTGESKIEMHEHANEFKEW
jgi:hypothetical protein